MTDIRRFLSALAPGVVVLPGVQLLLVGVCCGAVDVDLDGSGVLEGVSKSFEFCRFGARAALDLTLPEVFVSSAPLSSARLVNCLDAWPLVPSALAFLPLALGLRLTVDLSDASGAANVPGPTDFLGAFGAVLVLLNEFGGKWLCLLPRSIEVVVVAIGSDLTELLELLDAVELLRVIGVTPEPFRDGIGIATCEAGFFWSTTDVSVALAALPRPGRGK